MVSNTGLAAAQWGILITKKSTADAHFAVRTGHLAEWTCLHFLKVLGLAVQESEAQLAVLCQHGHLRRCT